MTWIFPRRNLNQDADDWGRVVEDRLRELDTRQSVTDQTVQNDGRGTSGQLATLSSQIGELFDRSLVHLPVPSMTVSGHLSAGSESVSVTSSYSRSAIVVFNSDFTDNSGTGVTFVSLLVNGVVVAQSSTPAITGFSPPGWPDRSVSMGFAATLPPGVSNLTFRLQTVQQTATFSVSTYDSAFDLYFGNRV